MDNKIYQDDELEQFLQEEVKQHRMYPSDHIWKNIRTELHGYKAWPALTFISLFILTALTVSTLLNNHPAVPVAYQPLSKVLAAKTPAAVSPVKQLAPKADATTASEIDYFQSIDPAQVTAETFANTVADAPQEFIAVRNTRIDDAAVPVKISNDRLTASAKTINRKLVGNDPEIFPAAYANTSVLPSAEMMAEENKQAALASAPAKEFSKPEETAEPKKTDAHPSADEFLKDFNYVTNKPKPRNSKFGIQFYVTPSTSYRRLSDEKVKEVIQAANIPTTAVQNIPLSASPTADVNNVVRHKPAIGFEAGFAVLYNMSGSLKFKTGVQLNIRQYYIETFQSTTNDLTSLSLINTRGVETISFYSPYNNNTGYKKTQLDNKIYQVSVPIGIQWDMIQGKHFGISTEASVQPTLTLNKNTYLLSTDYKHYTGGNEFMRKWNINTSVGLNLTYQSGKASWQIGPQVRYQHLPTFSNLYPIKEYLMDYGIRLGYTRQIR
jgi:hypothetical protein